MQRGERKAREAERSRRRQGPELTPIAYSDAGVRVRQDRIGSAVRPDRSYRAKVGPAFRFRILQNDAIVDRERRQDLCGRVVKRLFVGSDFVTV